METNRIIYGRFMKQLLIVISIILFSRYIALADPGLGIKKSNTKISAFEASNITVVKKIKEACDEYGAEAIKRGGQDFSCESMSGVIKGETVVSMENDKLKDVVYYRKNASYTFHYQSDGSRIIGMTIKDGDNQITVDFSDRNHHIFDSCYLPILINTASLIGIDTSKIKMSGNAMAALLTKFYYDTEDPKGLEIIGVVNSILNDGPYRESVVEYIKNNNVSKKTVGQKTPQKKNMRVRGN